MPDGSPVYAPGVSLHSLNGVMRRVDRRVRPTAWRAFHPGIDVGSKVRIGRGCRLFLDPGARLVLGDGSEVDDGTTIAVYGDGVIELGARSSSGIIAPSPPAQLSPWGLGSILPSLSRSGTMTTRWGFRRPGVA